MGSKQKLYFKEKSIFLFKERGLITSNRIHFLARLTLFWTPVSEFFSEGESAVAFRFPPLFPADAFPHLISSHLVSSRLISLHI
jgi:hypothetical protein